jgi:predicted membrane protein
MENIKNRMPRNENSKIAAGIILVGIGIALLLRNMGMLLPNWLFTWPIILIIVGIYTGIKHNFKNNAWYILIGIGGFFLIEKFIPNLRLEPYFWPILIIVIGIIYIIKPRRSNWERFGRNKTLSTEFTTDVQKSKLSGYAETVDSNDEFTVSSVFSGVNKNIISKNFQRAKISAVFGGADIDMGQCDINGTAIIFMEVAFGGVKLVVPPNWVVKNEVNGVFHGIEDKRYNNGVVDSNKVLILRGSCTFGGVEIKSY